jgi:uncharacterized protein YukE
MSTGPRARSRPMGGCDVAKWAETIAELRAEAANIAAQRDEAIARAEVAEERLATMQRSRDRYREAWESEKRRFSEASAKWHGESAELARIRAADRKSITAEARAND